MKGFLVPLGTYAPAPATPLRVGGATLRLPRLQVLSADEAERYWKALGRAGLRYAYGAGAEHQSGTSFDLPRALGEHLVGAARRLDDLLQGYVRDAGGLAPWLASRAPVFGGRRLGCADVYRALETRMLDPRPESRARLPFILDLMLTVEGDAASLRVVELQTGFGYADILWRQLEALGHDPHGASAWSGRTSPRKALARLARDGAVAPDDDAVSVLATFPSRTQNLRDEVGWAALLSTRGRPDGFFLATDLERDVDGFWHCEHEIDPATGGPLLDEHDRPRRRSGRRRRVRRVVTMQTQRELDDIYERLRPAERAAFEDFAADGSVTWLFPNAAWYIADKSLMARFAADLRAEGSPYAELFTICHGAGSRVIGPGRYVVKPVRGVGGVGLSSQDLAPGEAFDVPADFIAQARFTPFALPIRLPECLAGAFPIPRGAPLHEAHMADPRLTTASLELRVFCVPGSTEREDAYMFAARAAPTWHPTDPREPVLTNQGKIQAAIWASPRVDAASYRQLPLGWCVVTAGAIESMLSTPGQ